MNKSPKPEQMSDKIIFSFYEQFATNQNHHQTIFIQFLSAILVVLTGYGYIFANTSALAELIDLKQLPGTNPAMTSFSFLHLFGTYIIAQLILTLLGTVILNMGYGFRRDQKVIYNFRRKNLRSEYADYFGKISFNPAGRNLADYQPEFNRMFYFGIALLHLLMLLSFGFKTNLICSVRLHGLGGFTFWAVSVFPVLWSIWLYLNYYKKYYWVMTDSKDWWFRDLKNLKHPQ